MRLDLTDAKAVSGYYAVWRATEVADNPLGAPASARLLGTWAQRGFTGDPAETWFIRDQETGDTAGWYRLELPDLENRDRASLHIVVHPERRRRGFGRSLLRHAASRAAELGRAVFGGEVRDGLSGDAFASWAGAAPGIAEALRVLDLRTVPAGKLAGTAALARRVAAGYSLVSWAGPTPERYLEHMAALVSAYGDAPRDEGVEAENIDADRIRTRIDASAEIFGMRRYTVGAVQDATGELAAMTQLMVDPDDPSWGRQGLTAVTRAHRGHRLGLLVKTAMVEWMASAEPRIERIETGNASDNSHMIAVNDALGFELIPPEFHTVELTVADALQERP